MGLSSLYTSADALSAMSTGISVVGDNLANSNTVGFKTSRTLFDTVLTQVMGGSSPTDSGHGVEVQQVQTQFTPGTVESTNNPLDFAISGDGFFIVKDTSGTGDTSYTRDGQFSLNKNGSIVNANGLVLQGYLADSSGNISKSLTNLTFGLDSTGNLTVPAQATSTATVSVNLSSTDALPKVNSAFTTGSNTIAFTDSSGNTYTATIPAGTLTTGADLASVLQTSLNTATTASGTATTDTFTVAFDNASNVLTINNTGSNNVTLFTSGSTLTPQQIGFSTGTTSITAGGQAASSNVAFASGFSKLSGPAAGTFDYSSTTSVYDSAGNTHNVTVYFGKAVNSDGTWNTNNWNSFAVWDTAKPDANGNISHNYQYQQLGNMTFSTSTNSSGQTVSTLSSPTAAQNINLTWDSSWGVTSPQTVALSFSNSTQYASGDSSTSYSVNGNSAGGYTSFKVNADGTLDGVFSNGQEKTLAQLVLAKFNAPTQLAKEGSNLYAQTDKSGASILSTPGTGGVGTVEGASLEVSNVDTATEFVKLISLQQGFTENTTVISTTNEMFTTMLSEKT
ncbi:MAG: flagellar hook-basal body complex protein [Nitrospirae bacterium]|nr:flagellar hook-basal body complex protein [Nitrospirota bacterium]